MLSDLQQAEIFETFGGPVVDSRDLLADPEGILRALCQALGVPFTPRMLAWPPGPRDTDGAWAPYWYASVQSSTGFTPYRPPTDPLPARLEPLAEKCTPYFSRLHRYRLTCQGGEYERARGAPERAKGAPVPSGLRSEERATREDGA